MNKSLLALTVLGAFAGAASAQSSVTLSGGIDLGIRHMNDEWNMGTSNPPHSHFTLSGTEDLGNGLKAIFLLNHRFSPNNGAINVTGNSATQSPVYFYRNSWVGLAGSFGDVRLGRILMPMQTVNYLGEPWNGGDTVGNVFTGGIQSTIRSTNAIYYRSPNLGGLQVHAGIGAAEGQIAGECSNCSPVNAERPLGLAVVYAAGPLTVAAAFDRNTADRKTSGLYGKYDFGAVILQGMFETGDTSATTEVDRWSISASMPIGAAVLKAGYMNRSDENQKKVGLGMDYRLSKRTLIYSDVGKQSGSGYTALQRKAMFDVGIRHTF